MGYFGGFLVTARQRGKKNQVTTQYSGGRVRRKSINKSKSGEASKRAQEMDAKIDKPERLHGRHVLNRYEDGMEKCIGCELCAAVCPAKCIHVRGADNDPDNPTSPG